MVQCYSSPAIDGRGRWKLSGYRLCMHRVHKGPESMESEGACSLCRPAAGVAGRECGGATRSRMGGGGMSVQLLQESMW